MTSFQHSLRNKATVSTLIRPLVFVGFFLVLAAVAFRGFDTYFSQGYELRWAAVGLVLAFFVLSVSCYWLASRWGWYAHLYMTLQAVLTLGLMLVPPYLDFWAILFLLLSAEAMLLFPHRTGYLWLGVFTILMAGALIYTAGWRSGLPMILLYGTGSYFFASFTTLMAQAEADKAELQEAHRQLQEHAAQAEELAVAQERNRLARDLHDSVTQTIFSITLTAESARILLERDPSRVPAQLARLQELAQGALAEMRSLISHLHPAGTKQEGLATTVRQHLDMLREQHGLAVELQVEGEGQLTSEQEEGLFRVIQEALNNVTKHARTDRALVSLKVSGGKASLLIEDSGAGFDPSQRTAESGHIGLMSMRERIEMQQGSFQVESQPGKGTRILVEVPCARGG